MHLPQLERLAQPRPLGERWDEERARAALEEANLPALASVLFQLTGDRRWLREPYAPTRTRGLDDNDTGSLDDATQDELRAAALEAVRGWHAGRPAAVAHPEPSLVRDMLSVSMGEEVPADYEGLILEQLDASAPDLHERVTSDITSSAIIIGAGISGIMAAIRLRELGIPFTIYEKNHDIGGTWWENQYPGAGVDTPSHIYSFTFFPAAWTSYFPKQPEVLAYLKDVVDRFDLAPDIRLGVEVERAVFDEDSCSWSVTIRDEDGAVEVGEAQLLISGVGFLNRPKIPDIPGLGTFAGPVFHSSHWPSGLDLAGKRVAVVGTGASAMQIVPAIVGEAEHVTVFQRTPQWAAPAEKYHADVTPGVAWLFANVPYYHAWYRLRLLWTFSDKLVPSLTIDRDWTDPSRSINAINDGHRRYLTRHVVSQLDGRTDLVERCVPSYPPFAKRMLLDNGWFAAVARDDVTLVPQGVERATESSLVSSDGVAHAVDIVVLATGFRAQEYLYPMEIVGRGGATLSQQWANDDPRAYLGITVPNFPNLFLLYGPNTNTPGGSFFFIAESQMRYVASLLRQMADQRAVAVECRPEVCDAYNGDVDSALREMIWAHPEVDTYYRNGRGRVVTQYPWRVVDYWRMTSEASLGDYVLVKRGLGDVDSAVDR